MIAIPTNPVKNVFISTLFAVWLSILFLAPCSYSGETIPSMGALKKVTAYTMENGIRVLIVERHFSPTASFYIRFRAGAARELEGKTGAAHFLEHMMFKGTYSLGGNNPAREKAVLKEIEKTGDALDQERAKGVHQEPQRQLDLSRRLTKLHEEHRRWYRSNEIDRLYSEAGAVHMNASTGQDMITYHVSLPANKAELWARIEADRLSNYAFREFYAERDVVREERRQRIDTDPDGLLYESFTAAAFMTHPYRRPVIGRQADIERLSIKDLKEFHRQVKAPQQMVIAIVGDVRTAEMKRLLTKYFGALPVRKIRIDPLAPEPPSHAEKLITVRNAAGERLIMGYLKPPPPAREDYVFDVIADLLTRDRTSRFHRELVEARGVAESIQAVNGLPGSRYPNLFCVFATVRHPHKIDSLPDLIEGILARLATESVPAAELEKVKNQLRADFLRRHDTNEGLASQLSYFEALLGDYRYLLTYEKNIASVTPAEINAVARSYLQRRNRTLAIMKNE